MAVRARLIPPQAKREEWPWHEAKWTSLSSSLLMNGERRFEAENYLNSGYGLRLSIEARRTGWTRFETLATVRQPSRLKGILVNQEYGVPFLAATQIYDVRPTPRKWLALGKTEQAQERFVFSGNILVTRSGSVGRATLAYKTHENIIISDDLLRIEPKEDKLWGWVYTYLRSQPVQAMMKASQYGHIIKHLEPNHLEALPVPKLRDRMLQNFNDRVKSLLAMRNRAYDLACQAEDIFENAIGQVVLDENPETGFCVKASDLFINRRRLEGGFYSPVVSAILNRFEALNLRVEPLAKLVERVWWMTRFKRVFGDEGVPYLSADELFSQNPPISKRVVVEQAEKPDEYFVKAGWILMACSGQVYGLNGSVVLMTKKHEGTFFSHDLIRIVPREELVRPGYLFTALGHPKLGRPLVLRNAYGTSIPHLEPSDVATIPIVRLTEEQENLIADLMEEAVTLRAEADELENTITNEAEEIIYQYLKGNTEDFLL